MAPGNIAEFFTNLTRGNLRWRQRAARCLEGGDGLTPQEFRVWTRLALDYSIGTPSKHVAEKPEREPFLFINYRPDHDPMEAKTTAMLAAKQEEERLLALEQGRPDLGAIIAAQASGKAPAAQKAEEAFEELEAVKPDMPDPSAVRDMLPPQRSQYERDRLPRGER